MILLSAQWSGFWNEPEMQIAAIAIVGLVVALIWYVLRRISAGPVSPDPWDKELSEAVENQDAVPLCTNCLEPHDENEHLCTHCGAPVGPCTNLMPPLYYYGFGQILRTGTSGKFSTSPALVIGYVAVAFTGYVAMSPLAPLALVYLVMLMMNVSRLKSDSLNGPVGSNESGLDVPEPPPAA